MLQETMQRLPSIASMVEITTPTVICNELHHFIVKEQLSAIQLTQYTLILEPVARDTALASALAALSACQEALLLILPGDHYIENLSSFSLAVKQGVAIAQAGYLVALSVYPTEAAIGYGYIKLGEKIPHTVGYHVDTFVEKPDTATAQNYINVGEYYWNSGIFIVPVSLYLQALRTFEPNILSIAEQAWSLAHKKDNVIYLDQKTLMQCKSQSIDYAVMEHSKQVATVILRDSGWRDFGGWHALELTKEKDHRGNVVQGDVWVDDVTDSYLRAEHRLLAAVDLHGYVVIETADAVLVASKQAEKKVKQLVQQLATKNRVEVDYHHRVYRPWGYYEVIDQSSCVKIKRIVVKIGASLSLQMHRQRAEHWIVIKGVAEVVCGDTVLLLMENHSTYIPAMVKHRLSNHGEEPLIIIEVQTGDYLGEDDIVRFEDIYGREQELIGDITIA